MRKLLIIGLVLTAGSVYGYSFPANPPTLGCDYATWTNYMQSIGCMPTSLGMSKSGENLFSWRLSSRQTITCGFKYGRAVGVMIELPSGTKWTSLEIANMTVNLTGTKDEDWSEPFADARGFMDLTTKDGRFIAKVFRDNLIFVGVR